MPCLCLTGVYIVPFMHTVEPRDSRMPVSEVAGFQGHSIIAILNFAALNKVAAFRRLGIAGLHCIVLCTGSEIRWNWRCVVCS